MIRYAAFASALLALLSGGSASAAAPMTCKMQFGGATVIVQIDANSSHQFFGNVAPGIPLEKVTPDMLADWGSARKVTWDGDGKVEVINSRGARYVFERTESGWTTTVSGPSPTNYWPGVKASCT